MLSQFKELRRIVNRIDVDNSNLATLKISLLGDSSTQFLSVALKGVALERGFKLDLFEADYNQIERQVEDPNSDLYSFNANYTIVFFSTHKLLQKYNLLADEQRNNLADESINYIQMMCKTIPGKIILFNYPEIEDTVFGSYANKVTTSFTYQVRKLNFNLMNICLQNSNLFICDTASLQNKFGRNWMFDGSKYVNTEMVLSIDSLPFISSRLMDIICAAEGKFKKCIIIDLDNTIWGGIVGDDGWEKVQIGHNLGIGKAFTEFQHWIKKLKQRGIIIAVCSKNDEDKAKEPFIKNPEMVLTLDDIAVFIANWENKADNIQVIKNILNISYDSMVFIDDNPFERNIVRENIPDITVPELPEDPGDYLEYLYSLNLFETVSFSSLDNDRTKQYKVEAERVVFQKKFTKESDFLKSLDMVSTVSGFDSYNIPRVAQLSQRSNQFNLRTIRYSETEIAAIENNDNYKTLAFTLSDKFGENGLICIVILRTISNETIFVDSWIMSCRVLKRGMEIFALNTIADYAIKNGYNHIIGEYIPTQKNGIVANLYIDLGFKKINNSIPPQFELDLNGFIPKESYIKSHFI